MARAYVYTEFGGPGVETFIELPSPAPGPGQLLVAVHAAGVNPVDWKRRTGYLPPSAVAQPFPVVFGGEVSGVVEEVGPGVAGFAVGDAVFGPAATGAYAQYTLVPAELTAHKPAALSHADAATLPVAAATAYDGVHQLALPAGATLLITGAGGGVGVAATQLARHAGLSVVGVAGAGKKAFVESLGAVHVESGFGLAERVAAAAPGGIDAIYDLVGGATLEAVAGLLADRSKLITAADRQTVARLGGAPVARARTRAVLDAVAALVVAGVLDPHVAARFPLDRAAEALRTVEDGHAQGKVVIEVVS
jgi:NADPH:quinone reductase-like Zn-dependent oxidoreductase